MPATRGLRLPRRLRAADPGWTAHADVVVVGSGIAGLTAALRLQAAGVGRVLVVTKDALSAGSTQWAQGGIAAALGPEDSPLEHEVDTLVAGAGACDPAAVRALVTEGPAAVRELIRLGAVFDAGADGELLLTREGGHHRDRIAHAGGDATGAEIQRALVAAVERSREIEVIHHAHAVDLLLTGHGSGGRRVAGLTLHVMGEGQRGGTGAVLARAVVLASGGLGQVFSQTTNPAVATGDGLALALRAGARLRDLEFVQFHPTVMYLGPDSRGQQPLVSEAVRGEGAVLLDARPEEGGTRFMLDEHELADLAPRDVVAKAMMRRMLERGQPHVWLDARHLGEEFWQRRFPTILATCRSHGVDPVRDLVPVAPACHYASGGIATDLWGRSSVPGLYATGESACSGVHGANRLASNSLLEGLVFSRRIAEALPADLAALPAPGSSDVVTADEPGALVDPAVRRRLQETMSARAGVVRTAAGLDDALAQLADLAAPADVPAELAAWEATNLVTVAAALALGAATREETRGSHWRDDHPERDDERWSGHLDVALADDGRLTCAFTPAPPSDADLPTVPPAVPTPAPEIV